MANFVLVPGAMHGSWCWQPVRDLLEADGHSVATPALTGMGERADELTRETGTAEHVGDVVAAAGDADGVVLGLHSYSGALAGPVAERLGPRLGTVVMMGAFVVHPGECLLDVEPADSAAAFRQLAAEQGEGYKVPFQESFLERWGVPEGELAELLRERLTPFPLKCGADPVDFDPAPLAAARRIYVDHIRPDPDPLTLSVERARAEGWEMHKVDTTHDLMLTEPDLTAGLLEEIARG